MANYVTTHNADGLAIFSKKIPREQSLLPIPIGEIRIVSSTHEFPLNLSSEKDVDQYEEDRRMPFFSSSRRICPDNGTATCIMSIKPQAESGMHRTMTLDTVVVTEGEVEITLDSGEKAILKTGDSVVQRATVHNWKNVTPNNGWARMFISIQSIAEPLQIGAKTLTHDWQ